jgi:hypothetical protein
VLVAKLTVTGTDPALLRAVGANFLIKRTRLRLGTALQPPAWFKPQANGSFNQGVSTTVAGAGKDLTAEQYSSGRWNVVARLSPLLTFKPPVVDVTPPLVTGVTANNITNTSALISWTTNEASTSQVDYGTTTGYALGPTTADPGFVLTHGQLVSGLSPTTLYHYRVRSTDRFGNSVTGSDNTFTTLTSGTDTTPPVLTNVVATPSVNGVTIAWDTSENANGQFDYGTTTAYGSSSPLVSGFVLTHFSITVGGLAANTAYHFRCRSADPSGNIGLSTDGTFTTLPSGGTPPANLQAAIDATPSGGVLDCFGGIYSTGTAVYAYTINHPMTIKNFRINVTSALNYVPLRCVSSGISILGATLAGFGVTGHGFATGILAEAAHGLDVGTTTITDFMYAGIGEMSVTGGRIHDNLIQRIGPQNVASGDGNTNAYGIFFSDTTNGASPTNGVECDHNVIEDIPSWMGINTHNGQSLNWHDNTTRRCRRAYFLAPQSGTIGSCIVNNNRAEALTPGTLDPTAYFISVSNLCQVTNNFQDSGYNPPPDGGEWVNYVRDYLNASTSLTRTGNTVGSGGGGGGGGGGPAPFTQYKAGSSLTASLDLVFDAMPITGHTLVVIGMSTSTNILSVSGGGVTTWSVRRSGGTTFGVDVYSGIVGAGPSQTVTITHSGAVQQSGIVLEYPGTLTYDVGNNTAATSTTISSSSVTPGFTNEVVIAAGGVGAAISAGPTGGFTTLGVVNTGGGALANVGFAFLVETTAVAASTTWTTTSNPWDGIIAAFKTS